MNESGAESVGGEENPVSEQLIEGRSTVLEAFHSGKMIDKPFVLDGCKDGSIRSIAREARKRDAIINYVAEERLDQLLKAGKHQSVIAMATVYEYAEVEDIPSMVRRKGEPSSIFLLDGIEDPHNLGAVIRTANLAGAHGVITPKRRTIGLTATVARISTGVLNYTPVAKMTNPATTIEDLKEKELWFVYADIDDELMYHMNLTRPIGLVIGNEGGGVGRLVRKKYDMITSIPTKGDTDFLNASVAAGVLVYEIMRQGLEAK